MSTVRLYILHAYYVLCQNLPSGCLRPDYILCTHTMYYARTYLMGAYGQTVYCARILLIYLAPSAPYFIYLILSNFCYVFLIAPADNALLLKEQKITCDCCIGKMGPVNVIQSVQRYMKTRSLMLCMHLYNWRNDAYYVKIHQRDWHVLSTNRKKKKWTIQTVQTNICKFVPFIVFLFTLRIFLVSIVSVTPMGDNVFFNRSFGV